MIIEARAYARAGLLGNPSDGYFGKTISVSVRNFGAQVLLYETPELVIEPQIQDVNRFRNVHHLVESVGLTGYYGGDRLIKAAIKKFTEYCAGRQIRIESRNFTIRYHSSIPRQVGLAGSSAIIVAALRALMSFYRVEIPLDVLPTLALKAETEELGINAGLQDRVIQVWEGCVYMDFDRSHLEEKGYGRYERMDPGLLPRLYIAYKTELGKVSGKVLNDVRVRYEKGDPIVLEALANLAGLAFDGREALLKRDYGKLHEMIDENFNLRAKIMRISDSNWEMINTARACGASAAFSGSGGALIGMV